MFLLVIIHHGYSLFVVDLKSFLESIHIVVGTLNKWFASDIIDSVLFRWVEDFVVGSTTSNEEVRVSV